MDRLSDDAVSGFPAEESSEQQQPGPQDVEASASNSEPAQSSAPAVAVDEEEEDEDLEDDDEDEDEDDDDDDEEDEDDEEPLEETNEGVYIDEDDLDEDDEDLEDSIMEVGPRASRGPGAGPHRIPRGPQTESALHGEDLAEEDIEELFAADAEDSMNLNEMGDSMDNTDAGDSIEQLSSYESDEDDDDEEELTEDDSTSAPPPTKSVKLTITRVPPPAPPSRSTTQSPASSSNLEKPAKRRPGRPSKAEMARRALERAARGEEPPEEKPKARRGRKPRSEEEKARIKAEKKAKKKAEREAKRQKAREEKAALKAAKKGRRGRRAKILTPEEIEAREELKKQRYEEFKRQKQEAKAKRLERNLALREFRKKKKEEEKRQREAFEKRMQALKATFLDENSHLSGGAEGAAEAPIIDETSQSSVSKQPNRVVGYEFTQLHFIKDVTAGTLFEYRWPPGSKTSEHYFLQEQVSEYLGIKSFKRKYPNVIRRPVEAEERDFLVEMHVVNETQADLGLTALLSTQVLDIMSSDFYDKYDEYMTVVSERKDKTMKMTTYSTAKSTDSDFVDKSSKAAAEWNKKMNIDRKENRASYFDMQTFQIHYPITNRGRMRILQRPKVGYFPVSVLPGQFVDYYRTFNPNQLRYLPLNSTLKPPPPPGATLYQLDLEDQKNLALAEAKNSCSSSEWDSSDSDSSSGESRSDLSSRSSSSSSDSEAEEVAVISPPPTKEPEKPKVAIDAEIPGATCRICSGDRIRNKIGQPEKLLHCSKCSSSCHPTCAGLMLELLSYVTSYNWECTECKVCSKCQDHSDEDKMLFCDLCDRGDIPSGRWHCRECTYCVSCKVRDPDGVDAQNSEYKWVQEYKTNAMGNKIYSHTMCKQCHRAWKRTQYCPECNVVYGRESFEFEYWNCMVCSRQHHSTCVKGSIFICSACQAKTLSKTIGSGNLHTALSTPVVSGLGGPGVATTPASAIGASGSRFFASDTSSAALDSQPSTTSASKAVSPGYNAATRAQRLSSTDSGPQTCQLCQKVYKNKSTLYAHMNRDHGMKAAQQRAMST